MKYSLKVNTGNESAYSIFAREYILKILKETPDYSVVSFYYQDKCPSSYNSGGLITLVQNIKVKITEDDFNKTISKMALKFDPALNSSGSKLSEEYKSILIIKKELEKIVKNPSVIYEF